MTRPLLVSALVAVLATGCGGGGGSAATPAAATAPVTTTPAPSFVPADIAKVMLATPALNAPAGVVKTQLATSIRPDGGPTQLLVLGHRRAEGKAWLRVLLPTRPNGASAWIPRDDARLSQTPWKVVVSLADRRVYVSRRGRLVRSFPVVVGAKATPTPTGRFAVAERIPLPNPNQFYGSWMLTLTAHSTVLNTFAGGDGQVALHGRGGASLRVPVGTAASHGCVRMRNADIAWLARHAEAGTPVIVVANGE
jgi:lipoprotein-anchoring transpeptidase ErfK/SrfK